MDQYVATSTSGFVRRLGPAIRGVFASCIRLLATAVTARQACEAEFHNTSSFSDCSIFSLSKNRENDTDKADVNTCADWSPERPELDLKPQTRILKGALVLSNERLLGKVLFLHVLGSRKAGPVLRASGRRFGNESTDSHSGRTSILYRSADQSFFTNLLINKVLFSPSLTSRRAGPV